MTEATQGSAGNRKRRHVTGEATRLTLLETAERLFAERGIEGVTLREIQLAAGQSNSSVIAYHFGSKQGLVRSLVEHRQVQLDRERARMVGRLRAEGRESDPRSVVWVVVRPLADSVQSGDGYVAFLARLFENLKARTQYWPEHLDDSWGAADMERLVEGVLNDLPPRLRGGRSFQLFNSVISLLGEHCRNGRKINDAQLRNYVDGWVGLLTAPLSDEASGETFSETEALPS